MIQTQLHFGTSTFSVHYIGHITWNRRKVTRRADGSLREVYRPDTEWIVSKKAHPAIISQELWDAVRQQEERVQAHLSEGGGTRTAYTRHLLVGVAKCAVCGGNLTVAGGTGGGGKPYRYYTCGVSKMKGTSVCPNRKGIRKDKIEPAVLNLIKANVLTPETVRALVEDINTHFAQFDKSDRSKGNALERQIRKVETQIANLVEAIKQMGISKTLKGELEVCEERRAKLEAEWLKVAATPPPEPIQVDEQEVKQMLDDLGELLEYGTPVERRDLMAESIEEIQADQQGNITVTLAPEGLIADAMGFSLQTTQAHVCFRENLSRCLAAATPGALPD